MRFSFDFVIKRQEIIFILITGSPTVQHTTQLIKMLSLIINFLSSNLCQHFKKIQEIEWKTSRSVKEKCCLMKAINRKLNK